MQTNLKTPKYPTVTVDGDSAVEVHDVKRLEHGDQNMLGAVVPGGLCSADCFEDIDNDGDLY